MNKLLKLSVLSLVLTLSSICLATELVTETSTAKTPAPQVLLSTTMGEIVLELYPDAAPASVDNFISYVEDKFYDGIIFHRVIKNFMIQAGGHRFDMTPKAPTRPPIVNESDNGIKNLRGTVAMARTRIPDSATSQFFINHKTNSSLDAQKGRPGYAVFAKVIKGMDVVDKIATTKTENLERYGNVPVTTVSIIKARIVNTTPVKVAEKSVGKNDNQKAPKK